MSNLWSREPAAILGAVSAVVALAVAFGLELSDEQVGALMAAVAAVLAVVTRQSVYAPETVRNLTRTSPTGNAAAGVTRFGPIPGDTTHPDNGQANLGLVLAVFAGVLLALLVWALLTDQITIG